MRVHSSTCSRAACMHISPPLTQVQLCTTCTPTRHSYNPIPSPSWATKLQRLGIIALNYSPFSWELNSMHPVYFISLAHSLILYTYCVIYESNILPNKYIIIVFITHFSKPSSFIASYCTITISTASNSSFPFRSSTPIAMTMKTMYTFTSF